MDPAENPESPSSTTTSSPSILIQLHKKQKFTSSIMPTYPTLSRDETIANLPPEYPSDALNQITTFLSSTSTNPRRLVVLDDDPTGTQTCHDISVLTVWDIPTLTAEFLSPTPGFFILTNSRALPPSSATTLIQEICQNVLAAATATGYSKDNLDIVLRGDSTLRGHFPLEVDVAQSVLGFDAPTWVLAPFFFQGGRFTIDDVHYVLEGEKLVPAGETQFARDATFGYKSSNLRDYVLEKAPGRFSAEKVHSVSLEDIRRGGPEAVSERLLGFPKGGVVIANAAAESDMHVLVAGLLLGTSCFCLRCGLILFDRCVLIDDGVYSRSKGCPLHLPHRRSIRLNPAGHLLETTHYSRGAPTRQPTRNRRSYFGGLVCAQDNSAA